MKPKIISALRKLTYGWEPRKEMSAAAKRAPATWECCACNYWCYDGTSEVNFRKLKDEFPSQNIKMEKCKDDHINPVIDVKDGFVDWNTLVERMFCPYDNWQKVCKTCHDMKTKEEREQRKQWRKKRKVEENAKT